MSKIFAFIGSLLLGLFGCQTQSPKIQNIIQNESPVLLDVRTPKEYAEGHVDNSINIPVQELAQRLNELNKQETVVVFCRSGNRSSQAKTILEGAGFEKVYDAKTWQNVKKLKENASK